MNDSMEPWTIPSERQQRQRRRCHATTVTNHYLVDGRNRRGMYSGTIDTTSRLPHGNGTMFYVDGSEYEGNWFRGEWSGFGTYKCPTTKASFQGTFLDTIKNGLFVVTYDDGRLYDGEFQMNVMGKGVMKSPQGTYWGHFDDDGRPHGRGKLVRNDGREYDGEFVHGVMEGHGRMTYAENNGGGEDSDDNNNSSFYLGSFMNGERHGLGVLVMDETIVHDGNWYNDEPIKAGSVPSSRPVNADPRYGTCQRLLGRIPKSLSPCSRVTKNKMTRRQRRKHLSSSHVLKQ